MAKMNGHHGALHLMTDEAEALERVGFVLDAVARLRRYRDTVNHLEHYPGTEDYLADRARDAENDTRVILKCALDCVNELRDSKQIDRICTDGLRICDSAQRLDLKKLFGEVKPFFRDKLPDLDTTFLEELSKLVEQLKLEIHLDSKKVKAKFKLPDNGEEHTFSFSPLARPGDLGRIGTAQLLGKAGPILTVSDPATADDDGHHGAQLARGNKPEIADAYAFFVGGLVRARDDMARHARVAQHFGRPHLKANGPFTPLAIVLIIAAGAVATLSAALIIDCANRNWKGNSCNWFVGLITLGLVLAFGAACKSDDQGCDVTVNGQQPPIYHIGPNTTP